MCLAVAVYSIVMPRLTTVQAADGKVTTPEIAPTPSPPAVTPAPTTTVAATVVTTG